VTCGLREGLHRGLARGWRGHASGPSPSRCLWPETVLLDPPRHNSLQRGEFFGESVIAAETGLSPAQGVWSVNNPTGIRGRVDEAVSFPLALLPGQKDVARAVLSKQTGAVLLLTAAIEWFTQLHYLSSFKDNETLDPFTRHIFKCHWLEESQHARMDHIETLRAFTGIAEEDRQAAIEDLIELVGALDGLLQQQAGFDVDNLERYLDRSLSASVRREVYARVLDAKRYTFIESGVTHPNFQELFGAVTTPAQQEKVQKALAGILQPA
jgi:hypothetical protein